MSGAAEAGPTAGPSLRIVAGGRPTDAEHAALVEALRTVRARRRAATRRDSGPVWAHAGRLEAHGRRRVDERVLLRRA